MKIGAAINGNIISEKSAEYALLHAKASKASLVLFFNQNTKDATEQVIESAQRIISLAKSIEVECSFEYSPETFADFINRLVEEHELDLIYCSTRAEKRFFEFSFSERLVKAQPNCAIAVVKIVSMHSYANIEKVGLYARNQQLRTELFTLSAALCNTTHAELVMTTNIEEKKKNLLDLPFNKQQRKLKKLDENLQPYIELSNMLELNNSIHRLFEEDVKEEQLVYLLSRNIDLLIFEAYKWPFVPRSIKNPAEQLFKSTPINCIIYYPEH